MYPAGGDVGAAQHGNLQCATGVQHHSGAERGLVAVPDVTIPSSTTAASLNFSYKAFCADTVANDWQEAQIQSSTGTMLAQVMKVCSNTQTWTRVYFNLLPYKGQTIRIYFNDHGNGNNLLTLHVPG